MRELLAIVRLYACALPHEIRAGSVAQRVSMICNRSASDRPITTTEHLSVRPSGGQRSDRSRRLGGMLLSRGAAWSLTRTTTTTTRVADESSRRRHAPGSREEDGGVRGGRVYEISHGCGGKTLSHLHGGLRCMSIMLYNQQRGQYARDTGCRVWRGVESPDVCEVSSNRR